MAVHSHVFRPYEGVRTALHTRWMVIARYALAETVSRKLIIALLVLSVFPLLGGATLIYLRHNLEAIKIFEIPADALQRLVAIDGTFFYRLLFIQCVFAFVLTAAAGPRVLINDLRDNALPLYLSRPLTRVEYVLGKASALALLTSLVTWVPLLLLIGLQASLADGWLAGNWWMAPAVFVAAWTVIPLYALACLAVAAVVRRRAISEAAFVAMFVVIPLIAGVVNQFLHAQWWQRFFLPAIVESLWSPLFRLEQSNGLSAGAALLSLAVALVLASTVLLRRVRAWEIVR